MERRDVVNDAGFFAWVRRVTMRETKRKEGRKDDVRDKKIWKGLQRRKERRRNTHKEHIDRQKGTDEQYRERRKI